MQTIRLKPKEDAMEAKCDYGSSTGNYIQPKHKSMFQKRGISIHVKDFGLSQANQNEPGRVTTETHE